MEAGNFPEDRPVPVGAGAELTEIDAGGALPRTPWQLFWKRFLEDKLALGALVFIVLLVLIAIFAPVVCDIVGAPDPDARDTTALDPVFATPTGPSSDHLFGIDQLGRDVFARTVYGARVSLIVAFVATFLATAVGIVAGLLAGYFRGWTDTLVSRLVDVLLAIPYLLLATGIAAACTLEPDQRRRRGRLPRGPDQARARGGDLRDHDHQLDLHGADHPRPDAVAAREGVHRGVALDGRLELADHLPRAAART